jgi:hypothetical protein
VETTVGTVLLVVGMGLFVVVCDDDEESDWVDDDAGDEFDWEVATEEGEYKLIVIAETMPP